MSGPRTADAEWLTLDQAVAGARAQALSVAEARGAVGVAEAAGVGARVSSFNNPYLEIQADRGRFTQDVQMQGLLFLPVELMGQRGARIEEAQRLVEWRKTGLIDARARVTGEVVAAYGEVVTAASRLNGVIRAQQEAENERSYFSQRLQAADATILDKSLAEAEVARWAQARAEGRIRVTEALARLSQLMGAPVLDAPAGDEGLDAPAMRSPWSDTTISDLVQRSPALAVLRREGVYWDASRERFEREKHPPVNFIGLGGRGDGGELRAGGGMSWSFPITRRNQGEVATARAQASRAASVGATVRVVLDAQARAAYQTYVVSRDAVAEQKATGIPANERVADAALASYRAGKGDLLRVFIARRDLMVARSRRLDLVLRAFFAYGALAALKGELP